MDVQATSLNEAYKNFNPSRVLGVESLFYIDPFPRGWIMSERELLRSASEDNNKWFLIGHRGCGKSSYLKRLMNNAQVKDSYDTLLFSISETLDLTDLTYQDVIFSISAQLVGRASDTGCLRVENEKAFMDWGKTIFEETTRQESANIEANLGLKAVIAGFLAKLKTQYSSKSSFRLQVEPKINSLIEIIDNIAGDIETFSGKKLLLAIDDLDKATPEAAKKIFGQSLSTMLSPAINIVFTVPVSLMHEGEWQGIKDNHWYMPNVQIYEQGSRDAFYPDGIERMTEFVNRRMSLELIDDDALQKAITYGGGVFRQTCRIVQRAISKAEDSALAKVNSDCVDYAIAEYSNGMLPQLTREDLETMSQVYLDCRSLVAFERPKLMHNMSILMYPGRENWMDVNPVLWGRVREYVSQPRAT